MNGSKKPRIPAGALSALGLVALLAPVTAPVAEACSCMRLLTISHPCEAFHDRSVAFVGRAVAEPEVHDGGGWGSRTYTFAVEEPFAGVDGSKVEISTGMGGGDCGVDFEVGRATFVHAWRTESGDLHVGLCGTESTRDLGSPYVDYGRAHAAGDPGVAIFGRVTRRPAEAEHPPLDGDPIAGVPVTVHGARATLTAVTGPDGRFEIAGPLAGRFTVRAAVPGRAEPAEQEIEISGGRCQGVELVAGEAGAGDGG